MGSSWDIYARAFFCNCCDSIFHAAQCAKAKPRNIIKEFN
jgi:hypothetical protein